MMMMTLAAAPEADVCATKPFGQCSGMNFSSTKAERNLFNFTAPAETLACCPAGTTCITFGPVWGMCMPEFGAPKANEMVAAYGTLLKAPTEPMAVSPPLGSTLLGTGQSGKEEKQPEAEVCATKPFGQCSGFNVSSPMDAWGMHNFSALGEPFVCCPTGTKCMSFGPVWGMCMPAFMGPA